MATFGGTTFSIESPGYPLERRANVSVRHIPGGDEVYIDLAGKGPAYFRPRIVATESDYATLEGKIGTQASLVYEGGTVTAVLLALVNAERYDDDSMRATMELVITG